MAQRKNRSSQSEDEIEIPTGPDDFLLTVIMREPECVPCSVYNTFCYEVEGLTSDGRYIQGVCNDRAKKAGFNAPVSPLSMTRRPYERKV